MGPALRVVQGFTPLLASWERHDHPAQLRMRAYLDQVQDELEMGTLPDEGLYLDLLVDVEHPERLQQHYDLENYLTPIVVRLGWRRFVRVSARKQVGGGSCLAIGRAQDLDGGKSWRIVLNAGRGPDRRQWKAALRDQLRAIHPVPLEAGPLAVEIGWRCSGSRAWVNLWKPTGDAMGPILGEPDAGNPFNPADDRIVDLTLHREVDDEMSHDIDVAMSWGPAK